MLQQRAPIITIGQLYLNEPLNEYAIITNNSRGQITYAGKGFVGHAEDHSFIERFQPVNPADVDPAEIDALLHLCPPKTRVSTGFILES